MDVDTRNPLVLALAVTVGVLLAALVIAVGFYFATADDDLGCAVENAERAQDERPPRDCD